MKKGNPNYYTYRLENKISKSDLFQQTIKVGGKRDRLLVLIKKKIKCCFCFREGVKILMEWFDLTCNRLCKQFTPLKINLNTLRF